MRTVAKEFKSLLSECENWRNCLDWWPARLAHADGPAHWNGKQTLCFQQSLSMITAIHKLSNEESPYFGLLIPNESSISVVIEQI